MLKGWCQKDYFPLQKHILIELAPQDGYDIEISCLEDFTPIFICTGPSGVL